MELRDYQREGAAFMASRPRALLADEMGLGKSAQLITAAGATDGPVLVVAPAMVLDGGTWIDEIPKWADEPDRFRTTSYSRIYAPGSSAVKTKDGKTPGYSSSPGRWAKLIHPAIPDRLGAVIFDEAHYLKGRVSLRGNVAQAIARRADRVFLASGTPIPNYAPELYPLLQMLRPDEAQPGGHYGSYWRWVERWFHTTPSRYSRTPDIGLMRGCSDACDRRTPQDPCDHYREFSASELDGVFLQRLRDDVLTDLPPMTRVRVEVPMGPKQLAAYRSMKRDFVASIGDGQQVVAWSASAQHVQLDRLTTGLGVFTGSAKVNADNGKLARLAEDLASRSRPTLVVAHYQNTVEACAAVARSLGLRTELVYGPTSKPERLRRVRAFQNGELDVLVGSLETIAEGLQLVAADLVIFVENSWKPSRNEQALRRIHRIGQIRPVTALDYVVPDSLDAGKRELLHYKTDHQMRVLTAAQLARLA